MLKYGFEKLFMGGYFNLLGCMVEVVDVVLVEYVVFDEFFNCYFSKDEVVWLWVFNVMKWICKVEQQLLVLYIDCFLNEIVEIDQVFM